MNGRFYKISGTFMQRWGLMALSTLIPLWVSWRFRQAISYDDTYITLTYARNLAQGHGFVYNGGLPHLGTTSPLLALWLGALGALLHTEKMAQLALLTGGAAWVGSVWLAFWLGRKIQGRLAGQLMALLLATAPLFPHVLRAEFPLMLFFSLLALLLIIEQRQWLAGACFGLAFLARGDAALLAGLSGLVVLKQTRRIPWGLVGGFTLVLAPWTVYATLTLGSPLPATLAIKRAHRAYGVWPHIAVGFWRWFQVTSLHFRLHFSLTALLSALAALAMLRQRRTWGLVLIAWGALHAVAYLLLNVPFYFWYVTPVFMVAYLGAGLALAQLWEASRPSYKLASMFLLGIVLLLGAMGLSDAVAHAPRTPARVRAYLDTAAWLKENTARESTVGSIEVGMMAYFSERPFIDLMGLTTPGAEEYLKKGDIGPYFEMLKPDYYLRNQDADDWKMCKQVHRTPEFQEHYKPVATIPQRHRKPIIIYQRIPSATER